MDYNKFYDVSKVEFEPSLETSESKALEAKHGIHKLGLNKDIISDFST